MSSALGKGGEEVVVDEVGCENLEVEAGGADGSLRTVKADAGARGDVGMVDEIPPVGVMPCDAVAALPDGDLSLGDGLAGISKTDEVAAEA